MSLTAGALLAGNPAAAQEPAQADRDTRAFRRGQALFESGDYVRALREFQNAAILNPRRADAYYAQGLCLLRLDEPAQARRAFRRATEIEPAHAEALYNLGLTEAQIGDTAAARGHLHRALVANPKLPGAHFALARLEEKNQRPESAILELQRELEIAPDSAFVHYQIGYLLADANRLEEARGYLVAATRLDSSLAGAWLDLGVLERRLGHPEAAVEAFGQGLAADTTDLRLWSARADGRFALGDYAGAAADYRVLVRRDSANARAAFNWGVGLEKLEDAAGATAAYETAIARDSMFADPHLNLAVLLGKAGKEKEAIVHLERYLVIAPDAPNAEEVRALLARLRRLGRR